MGLPRLQLLGPVHAQVGPDRHPFSNDRRYHLLAFLAYRSDWIDRERLAALFWPEHDEPAARRNLRKLVFRTRALDWLTDLDPAPLEVEDGRLRWRIETDVAAFVATCDREDWEPALEGYGGPLLDGFETGAAPAFADWLTLERAHLAERWRQALYHGARAQHAAGRARDACDRFARLMAHDDLDESALHAYMLAARDAGLRRQALEAYRAFAERLDRELGLEPTSESQRLRREIEAGETGPASFRSADDGVPAAAGPPHPPLPGVGTRFVGRVDELAAVEALLTDGDTRLLTLIGPGGSGKTRLALEALRRLEGEGAFPDGVAFVPLEGVTDPAGVPVAIAERLAIPLQGSEPPLRQLQRSLRGHTRLVLLDNAEQLGAGAAQLNELLRGCPGLRLLITSRERLSLRGERLYPLGGLAYPDDPQAGREAIAASEAAQLFAERAARVRPDFALDDEDAAALVAICRLVDGAPLGLELAATWTRLLSCQEIADEIEANLDFLSSDARDADARHRSLRAVFESSWQRLGERERTSLRALAVFPGSFPRDAALRVADAPLPVLASLVDKSLLRLSGEGRFDRHPLVGQYLREALAADPGAERAALTRHCDWVVGFLNRLEHAGANEQSTLQRRLGDAIDDLRLAWRSAVDRDRWDDASRIGQGLMHALAARGRHHEGRDHFTAASDELETRGPDASAALATALAARSAFHYKLGDYREVAAASRRALELLDGSDARRERILPLTLLSAATMELGDSAAALPPLRTALGIVRRVSPDGLAQALCNLAVVEDIAGERVEAERHYREALALAEARGQVGVRIHALNGYGRFLLNAGQLDRAEGLFDEGLALVREHDLDGHAPPLVSHLARARWLQGDLDRARAYADRALALARGEGWEVIEVEATTTLGQIARDEGDRIGAEAHFREALRQGWACRHRRMALATLLEFAVLRERQGEVETAASWLALVASSDAAEADDRRRAGEMLVGLGVEPAGVVTLEEVVEGLEAGEMVEGVGAFEA